VALSLIDRPCVALSLIDRPCVALSLIDRPCVASVADLVICSLGAHEPDLAHADARRRACERRFPSASSG
jgi:hypothetical protein